MHTAEYRLEFDDPADADAIYRSLVVEADDGLPRTEITLEKAGDAEVVLHIEADDLTSLRAATNSYLKRIDAAGAVLAGGRS